MKRILLIGALLAAPAYATPPIDEPEPPPFQPFNQPFNWHRIDESKISCLIVIPATGLKVGKNWPSTAQILMKDYPNPDDKLILTCKAVVGD